VSDATVRNGEQAALALDAVALIDVLGIEAASVAGFDWGARTADIVAALWPERVSGLVSVSVDDATFDRSAASFDNPDYVAIVIHNYAPIPNRALTPQSSRDSIRTGRSRAALDTTSRKRPRRPSPMPSAS
jgi:pimeloyl-ACP methyl ester carboxylesterase